MQTFLPYEDFELSAKTLHQKHLGKQRVECKQIFNAMYQGGGWRHHACVRMWRGYGFWLLKYYNAICSEWISRGYEHNMKLDLVVIDLARTEMNKPPWLGAKHFHSNHRLLLVHKKPEHYAPQFTDIHPLWEYGDEDGRRYPSVDRVALWPVKRTGQVTDFPDPSPILAADALPF